MPLNENNLEVDRVYALRGLLYALVSALIAELLLVSFVEPEPFLPSLGRFTITAFTLYTVYRFALSSYRYYRPTLRDAITLTLVMVLSLAFVGIGKLLSLSLASYVSSSPSTSHYLTGVHAHSFEYGIPFATGGLLLQAVLGIRYGLVFGLSMGIIICLYGPVDPAMVPYVIATIFVGTLGFSTFRSRAAYLKAGARVSVIAVPLAFASLFLAPSITGADIVVRLVAAFLSGLQSAFLAAGFIPLLEYFGGYVTDLRLIEMATLDHPLLNELSVQCPGTWNHSMVMGMMVESAATEISANPVLARVGAYFHDIGKIKKPLYFIENQRDGENRHDKLSPSMSALIIRSHVKDGIDLARQHKVPENIVDMIPQHHGTSLIEYFYDKACGEREESGEEQSEVDSSLYSYPGPKPQTKEAGILMLADGVEAATRTLQDPSFDRIQGLVQKMINKVFASGQLDECELTLKDLHAIAKAFTRVLSGIYHQRIAYAESVEKGAEHESGGSESESRSELEESLVPPKEDLKRLGL